MGSERRPTAVEEYGTGSTRGSIEASATRHEAHAAKGLRRGSMISLRPRGFDDLGLRKGFADRMLPLLVAAMALLAALALAGWCFLFHWAL